MSLIVQISEILQGPIKDFYLEWITGPLFQLPELPPVDIQVGPETVGDLNLGSSFGDQELGSTAGDLGSTFGDLGSSVGDLGSTNGDQTISGLEIPGSSQQQQ